MLELKELSDRQKFRLKLRAGAITVGILAAYWSTVLLEQGNTLGSLGAIGLFLLASLGEFVFADLVTESKYPASTRALLDRLDKNLAEYHESIRNSIERAIESLQACDNSRVSGTFHLVVDLLPEVGKSTEALLQVTAYSGPLGGKRWRFTSAGKGIIGRCLRSRTSQYVNFACLEEYEERMVSEFGFSKSEVAEHSRFGRSYWAEPVRLADRLVGVIYFFSTEPQVFPRAVERTVLEGTAREIASFLSGAGVIEKR